MLALSAGAAAKKGSVSHIMPCAQSANAACHTMRDAVRKYGDVAKASYAYSRS